jgi:L-asparaginase
MQSASGKVVILGTGGTIAGTAASAADHAGYTSAQLGVADLVAAVAALAGRAIESEQVAQVDSKDMDEAIWLALARRAAFHLARPEVQGVVVTHGTDTLEETGYFLHRVLAPAKPLVLTAAMRPATSSEADGPRNLLDAVTLASTDGVRGVVAVLAGRVHAASELRKQHSQRIDAFGSGDAGVLARFEPDGLQRLRDWPAGAALGLAHLPEPPWPAVEIVTSHAGAQGTLVHAAQASRVRGLVVAATGNGTVHHTLLAALLEAQRAGVVVWRCTRCLDGGVLPRADDVLPSAGALTPVQARIELQLQLMGAAAAR